MALRVGARPMQFRGAQAGTWGQFRATLVAHVYVRKYACMHVCMCVSVETYIHIYTCSCMH